MSDDKKPLFGQHFGQSTPSFGVFGKSSAPSTSGQTSSLFGSTTSAPSSSNLFGSPATSAVPSTSASAGSLFGSGGFFGGGTSTGQTSNPFGGQSSSGGFTAFSTPSKPPDTSATSAGQTTGLFGIAGNTGGTLFGNLGNTPATSTPAVAATPATSKPAFAFGTSTTPAGPPPAGGPTNSFDAFSVNKPQQPTTNLFGSLGQGASQNQPSTSAPSNLFSSATQAGGSSIFGTNQPATTASTTSTMAQAGSNIFETTPSTSGGSIFGLPKTTSSTSGPSLFADLNKPATTTAQTTNIFGTAAGKTTTSASTEQKSVFSFPSSTTTQSAAPDTSNPRTTSAQSLFGAAPVQSPASTDLSTTKSSLFGGFTAKAQTSDEKSMNAYASARPVGSGLGDQNKTSESTTKPGTEPTTGAGKTGTDDAAKNANLGSSTSGPRPPAQSRLKNKSMDEIITRWASDLSKYQKEFQRQALKVAEWDRMLVENSDKIQKLYGSTLEAERATAEVERQLTAVENDQNELEQWLDHYEKQVDEMTAQQVGQGDALQGPDQERERTYKLTEQLSDRLNEMGKDLTSMIENINDASSTLTKNTKTDDPISQIVRVLNGHLSQLQQIDQGTAALQAKVAVAQRASRSMGAINGSHGIGSDAADDFYRSYMGRR